MVYKGQPEWTYGFLALFSIVLIRESFSDYLTVSLLNHTGCMGSWASMPQKVLKFRGSFATPIDRRGVTIPFLSDRNHPPKSQNRNHLDLNQYPDLDPPNA